MRLCALAVVITLAGCVTPQPLATRRPARATFAADDREQAWARALNALQARGYIIAVSDRTGGLITTHTMELGDRPCGVFICPARETVQVTLGAAGAATVNVHREMYLTASPTPRWFVPGAAQDVAAIEAVQDELLHEIVGSTATASSR